MCRVDEPGRVGGNGARPHPPPRLARVVQAVRGEVPDHHVSQRNAVPPGRDVQREGPASDLLTSLV